MASRGCAVGCLMATFVMARPAVASMTIAMRDGRGQTITFYQDGSRIRIGNPSGTDDGEARIIDLKTTEHVVVYDDAKAYYDYNKTLAQVRAAMERLGKQIKPDHKSSTVSFRALGETRQVNGFSCAMYEQLVDGRADGQICFAAWGGAVGAQEDFAWFDEFMRRMTSDVGGKLARKAMAKVSLMGRPEGLPVWSSSTNNDGTPDVSEIAKISRDPLPAAMFHVPADYKEFERPLTASEHPKIGPPPMEDVRPRGRAKMRLSGLGAIMLAFAILVSLMIQAFLLHLAASLVLENARFLQAFVASVIMGGVLTVVELVGLPPILAAPFGLFTVFAALKIAYGASIGRTLALLVVAGLIMVAVGLLARALFA